METQTLGERMKMWEHVHRYVVDADDYVLLRLDGKAFHSYTKGLDRPFDKGLMAAMDSTMKSLCDEIQGVRLGYCQSDEISLLITRGEEKSELWMGGVEAKMLSLSAAIASTSFNRARQHQGFDRKPALFDSRVWTLPNTDEGLDDVENYFIWRQRDAIKNSVTMAASAHFSHRFLLDKNTAERAQLLNEAGHPWAELPKGFRQGRMCLRRETTGSITWTHKITGEVTTEDVVRRPFVVEDANDFAKIRVDKMLVFEKS